MAKPRPKYLKTKYPKLLEEILSRDGNRAEFCSTTKISNDIFDQWRAEFEEFNGAYLRGREAGLSVFMAKVQNAAWEPTAKVNNSLIHLLAYNKYGIQSEKSVNKENKDNEINDIAKELKTISQKLPV